MILEEIIISIVVFTVLSIWSFISVRFKTGIKAFAILWMIITLGPSILVAILRIATTPMAERYLFLPICGFSLLVSYVAVGFYYKTKSKRNILILFFTIFLILIYFNVNRQGVWNDRVSFWESVSTGSKETAVTNINFGMALVEQGKVDEGLEVLENVFKKENKAPRSLKSIACNNIGIAYMNKKQPNIARKWFSRGVKYNPNFHKSYFHLALIDFNYAIRNKSVEHLVKAEDNLNKAIVVEPKYSRAYLLLARVALAQGKLELAQRHARKAYNLGLEKPLDKQALSIMNRKR